MPFGRWRTPSRAISPLSLEIIRKAFSKRVPLARMVSNHKAEVGFWLGKPFWNRGIMNLALSRARDFAVGRWNLGGISATVFEGNLASMRGLEKSGVEFAGLMRRHEIKNGRYIDRRLYSLLPDAYNPPF